MPVPTSYPGVYLEEVPSSNFAVTPAPTSVAVFVGYTHPFKTKAANWPDPADPASSARAVRVFSPDDYAAEFGGPVRSGVYPGDMAHAVRQFFLNGGSDAYVVGLRPSLLDGAGAPAGPTEVYDPDPAAAAQPTAFRNPAALFTKTGSAGGLQFVGLEPTDTVPLRVKVSPRVDNARADVLVTYGGRSETYRDVSFATVEAEVNGRSQLVRVRKDPATNSFPPDFDLLGPGLGDDKPLAMPSLAAVMNTFRPADFADALKADGELDKVPVFNLMVLPGVADAGVWATATAFCERKLAFLLLDAPKGANAFFTTDGTNGGPKITDTGLIPVTTNGAIYFPWVLSQDPETGGPVELPPAGTVAGVFARTDQNFGVWKAPAGLETVTRNVTGVVPRGRLTDPRHGVLNVEYGVNCLRTFPGAGTVVFGGRTLAATNKALERWKYVPVRRTALFIEQTLKANLVWAVFRPNDEPLWAAIRQSVGGFMLSLFRQGAFQGRTPAQAYQVSCDANTTTQVDVDNGRVNVVVAFAPLKPAEFVIVRIAQLAGQTQT